ncbi:hypothetical protein LTR93_011131 [Exophiala xenobiotica]|nr:hypothetical protein LTR93_011131 [Exophiala xenobiotica]
MPEDADEVLGDEYVPPSYHELSMMSKKDFEQQGLAGGRSSKVGEGQGAEKTLSNRRQRNKSAQKVQKPSDKGNGMSKVISTPLEQSNAPLVQDSATISGKALDTVPAPVLGDAAFEGAQHPSDLEMDIEPGRMEPQTANMNVEEPHMLPPSHDMALTSDRMEVEHDNIEPTSDNIMPEPLDHQPTSASHPADLTYHSQTSASHRADLAPHPDASGNHQDPSDCQEPNIEPHQGRFEGHWDLFDVLMDPTPEQKSSEQQHRQRKRKRRHVGADPATAVQRVRNMAERSPRAAPKRKDLNDWAYTCFWIFCYGV